MAFVFSQRFSSKIFGILQTGVYTTALKLRGRKGKVVEFPEYKENKIIFSSQFACSHSSSPARGESRRASLLQCVCFYRFTFTVELIRDST